MTINGKTVNFTVDDFKACAQVAGLKRGREREILSEVVDVVKEWARFADTVGVSARHRDHIAQTLRLDFGIRRRPSAKRKGSRARAVRSKSRSS
jgi:serine/threonine-protein kinase HipA